MVRILDLYCGMGGLSLGFVLGLEGAEILGLDIDRYAVATYNRNLGRFGCRAEVRDVLKWKPSGEYDIIMGGSPCQPFSLACTRKRGKEHPLYPTFPRFFDIVLELKPKVFLLENVKGLVTRRHRPLLEEQLGRVEPYYNIRYKVLNSAYYGVPQRRERLFVLGIRRDVGVVPSFPSPTHAEEERMTLVGRLHRWVTVREAIGDLLLIPPSNPRKLVYTPRQVERALRFRRGRLDDLDEPSRTIKVDGRGGDKTNDAILVPLMVADNDVRIFTPQQVERIRREREDTSRHFARMEFPDNLDKPSRTISSHTVGGTKRETIIVPITEHVMTEKGGWDNPRSDWGSRVMPRDEPSYTITEKHRSGQLVEVPCPRCKYRRLTVRECLRLQSFPDWWSFPSYVSTSRKYKLVGEAVCPILAYRLAIHIGKLVGWKVKEPPKYGDWQLPYFHRAFADYFGEVGKGWLGK